MPDFDQYLEKLPHGFPFRMIDRILEIQEGTKAVTLKNVSKDEPHLSGLIYKDLMMPGFLILEAMAQTGGLALQTSFGDLPEGRGEGEGEGEGEKGLRFLAGVEQFRLKRKVIPGDQIIFEAEVLYVFSNLARVKVTARVGEERVAEGTIILVKAAVVK